MSAAFYAPKRISLRCHSRLEAEGETVDLTTTEAEWC